MFRVKGKSINYQWLANKVTTFRLLLGLPILLCLNNDKILIGWLFILIGGFSDWLDGWLARRSTTKSNWGAQVDPLADKVMILVPMLWLLKQNILPLWSIWILISRELIVTAWRRNNSDGAPASYAAKLKTSLQFLSIILLLSPTHILGTNFGLILTQIGLTLFYLSILMSFISAYNYLNNRVN